MQSLEAALQQTEHLLESVEKNYELESHFKQDDGKKDFCIHKKLKEIYEQECEKGNSKIPIKPCYLLEKLVIREKVNTLIVNLFNNGFSIIYRVDNPAITTGFTSESGYVSAQAATVLVESPKWPYGFGSFLSQIEDGDLPPILAQYLDQRQTHLFYTGCVIAEIHDYRGNHGSPGSPSTADTHSSSSQIYTVRYILLRPSTQSILADVDALTSDESWTPDKRIALEKELVHATAEPLCLDPSPSVLLQTNSLQQRYRCLDNEATRRHLNKYTQENLLRRRFQSKCSGPSEEFRLNSFLERRTNRLRQSDIRISHQVGRHTILPNNNKVLSNGAVHSTNNTSNVFNNNKTNVTQNMEVSRKRKYNQSSGNNETNPFERLKTKIKSASSFANFSSKKFTESGMPILPVKQDLTLPMELSFPETSAPGIGELVNKFARSLEWPQDNQNYTPQKVDEYLLEGVRDNGRIRVKLSILQRPSTAEYLGEQYVERDYKDNSTEKKGHKCRFILGTRQQANRYIQQFTDSFRQDFPEPTEATKAQTQTKTQIQNHAQTQNQSHTSNHHHHHHSQQHLHSSILNNHIHPSTLNLVPSTSLSSLTPRALHVANQQLYTLAASAAATQQQQPQQQSQSQSPQLLQQHNQQQVTAIYPSHLTNGTIASPSRVAAVNSQQPTQIQSSVVQNQQKERPPMINPAISAIANSLRNNQFEHEAAKKSSLPMTSPPTPAPPSSMASQNPAIFSLLSTKSIQQINLAAVNKGNPAARKMTITNILNSGTSAASSSGNISRAATVLQQTQQSQQTSKVRVNLSTLTSQLSSPPPPPPTPPSPQQLLAYASSLATSGAVTFTAPQQPAVTFAVNTGVVSTGSKSPATSRMINLATTTTSAASGSSIRENVPSISSTTSGLAALLASTPSADNPMPGGSSNSYLIEKQLAASSSSANAAVNAQGQGSPSYAALPSTPSPKGPFPSAAASPLASPSSAPSPGGVQPTTTIQATQQQSVNLNLTSLHSIPGTQNVQVIPYIQSVPLSFNVPSSTAETVTPGIQQQNTTTVVTTNVIGLSNALAASGQQVFSLPVAQLMTSKTLNTSASANNVIATQAHVVATSSSNLLVNAIRSPRSFVTTGPKQQTTTTRGVITTTQRHALKNSVTGSTQPIQVVNAIQRSSRGYIVTNGKQATARGVFTAPQRQTIKTNAPGVTVNSILTTDQVVTLNHQHQLAIQRHFQAKAAAAAAVGDSPPPTAAAAAASNIANLTPATAATGGKPRRRSNATAESNK